MDFETLFAKTPATLDEIKSRVAYALERHPLCRNVQFDIVSMPRSSRGGNWTISLQSVAPDALWEASDIVADIQDAYELDRCGLINPPSTWERAATGTARLGLNYHPAFGKLTVVRPGNRRVA